MHTGSYIGGGCVKDIYDHKLPTGLKTDKSSEGLAALLEQNHGTADCEQWFAIAFASRALTLYERNYAGIEKPSQSYLELSTFTSIFVVAISLYLMIINL